MEPVKEIPVSKILIPKTYNKLKKDGAMDKLDPKELMESIKLNGLLQPICVNEVDGKYILLYGKNRLNAYKNMRFKTIPSIVKQGIRDEVQAAILQLSENLLRNKPTLLDYGRYFIMLENDYKLNREQTAQRTGKSLAFIVQCINVYKSFPKKDHKKIKTVSPVVLTKLASGVKNSYIKPAQAKEIADTVKTGLVKAKDVNNIINNFRKENNLEIAVKQNQSILHVTVTIDINKKDMVNKFGTTTKMATYVKNLFYSESGIEDPNYRA